MSKSSILAPALQKDLLDTVMASTLENISVKKFGGTSVGSTERIEAVAERLANLYKSGERFVVVSSAMSGETNRLVALAQQIDPKSRGSAYDQLLASGEQVAISLVAIALQKRGVPAEPLLAHQVGLKTDRLFSKARIVDIETQKLLKMIESGVVPIVAGFQGVTENNEVTTLGRGGSDTTAVALAAALGLKECEIFTDVEYVCTADPRLVARARAIPRLAFEEMMEMASLGSKVLHIRSVEIAAKYGVRIHVRSSFSMSEGTWIVEENNTMEQALVTSVTHDAQTAVIELSSIPSNPQFLSELFQALSQKGISVDIINQSLLGAEPRLAFSVTHEDLPLALTALETFEKSYSFSKKVSRDKSKISVIGVGMRNHPGVAALFFKTLAELNIQIDLVTTSEIKISAVIDPQHLKSAAESLHMAFSLDK